MTQLKTLKDLIERADKGNGLVTTIGIKKMLKSEAVKWRDDNSNWNAFLNWAEERSKEYMDDISNIDLVNLFIEYFFNLTEEDLK